jgi:hypothetical protein
MGDGMKTKSNTLIATRKVAISIVKIPPIPMMFRRRAARMGARISDQN